METGPVTGYAPSMGDLEWDGRRGDERHWHPHSGGDSDSESESRAALPSPGQQRPAVEALTGSRGWVFRAYFNPFLSLFGA